MAKPKIAPPKKVDVAHAASQVELPGIKWKVVGAIAGGFGALWVVALMATQSVGYWGVGIMGGVTLAALGAGLYLWRMIAKQREILDLMKGAGDEQGRKLALERLSAGGSKDAMKALAHAQLLAQEDPQAAIEALEAIDIDKAPSLAQDEVRAQRAMMYLFMNRPKDARPLADAIKIERQPEPKAKAKYVAVVAEAFARTGKADEAKKLLEEHKADDPRWVAEVGPLLYRAQVYTFFETKNRGLVKKALDALVKIEPNMLSPFVQKGVKPELQKLALAALGDAGLAPRAQMKMRQKL